ncbi:MAG: class I SAM-dependent methyltransferase [Candidatus Omnitrophica bacterium]|nr:class I SAM-dependent methyltransferase [Candidatus Omnitrophota bacterium]
MFEQFPKQRPELPPIYREIFQKHYLENREGLSRGSSLTRRMEAWMHQAVARDVCGLSGDLSTLEIGAGTLNHLPYENNVRVYDAIEPNEALVKALPERRGKVRDCYRDIFEVPSGRSYGRVISIATFEHLTDLPAVVARAGMLLKDGGSLRVAIPNEGRWPWTLGYRLTNGLEFRLRYKLDYDVIMKHEHVNTADEIEVVLRHFFADIRCRVFGLTRGLSFYRFYECRMPVRERCQAQLSSGGRH